jgi:hypothetical protein
VRFAEIASFVETTFKPISEARHLRFTIETDTDLPASMETDLQRLNQILKNLLSNSFKFTEKGEVKLRIYEAERTWKQGFNPNLDNSKKVVALPSAIQASAYHRKSRTLFLKPSSRPRVLPAANMAAPGWGCRSAGVSPSCSVAPSSWKANREEAAHLPFSSR